MTLAVLGREYELLKCLSHHDQTRVFLASNPAGKKFVIKFIADPNMFFDELARHFAIDGANHVCTLVYNYPSYKVSGEPLLFEDDIVALFPDWARFDPNETIYQSRLADVGALVISYVDGVPLLDYLEGRGLRERSRRLAELARAIEELHGYGECHGDLIAPNVLVEQNSGRITLVNLGYFPDKSLPLGQFRSPLGEEIDHDGPKPSDDVYMMARNFMKPLFEEDPKLHSLLSRCLQADGTMRPSIGMVRSKLVKRAEFHAGTRSLSKRSKVLTSAAMIVLGLLSFKMFQRWQTEQSTATFQTAKADPIIQRQLQQAFDLPGPVVPISQTDIERPIAVFSHPQAPLLITSKGVARLGSRLQMADQIVTLAALNSRQIVLRSSRSLTGFRFRSPGFPHKNEEPAWVVWNHRGNLPLLVDGLRSLADNPSTFDALSVPVKHLVVAPDTLYGFFREDDVAAFSAKLQELTSLQHEGDDWILSSRHRGPLHYRFQRFLIKDATVKGFCRYLSHKTGLLITCPARLNEEPLPVRMLNDVSWQEVLDALGLEWHIEGNQPPRIVISDMQI